MKDKATIVRLEARLALNNPIEVVDKYRYVINKTTFSGDAFDVILKDDMNNFCIYSECYFEDLLDKENMMILSYLKLLEYLEAYILKHLNIPIGISEEEYLNLQSVIGDYGDRFMDITPNYTLYPFIVPGLMDEKYYKVYVHKRYTKGNILIDNFINQKQTTKSIYSFLESREKMINRLLLYCKSKTGIESINFDTAIPLDWANSARDMGINLDYYIWFYDYNNRAFGTPKDLRDLIITYKLL